MDTNHLMQIAKLALLCLISFFVPGSAHSLPNAVNSSPNAQETCPAGVGADGCVKPLTGCICATNGAGTLVSLPNCGGCMFELHGTIDCTNPYSSTPLDCVLTISCDTRGACSVKCPCTGMYYSPIRIGCGSCP